MNREQRREQSLEKHQSWELPATLIVEMDGAFVDSTRTLYETYMAFLQKLGLLGTKSEFLELIGLPLPEFLVQLCDRHGIRKSQDKLTKEYEALLLEKYNEENVLLPDVEATLQYANQLGLSCILICAMTKSIAKQYLKKKNIYDFFTTLIFPEESEALPIELSNMYHRALAEQGSDPSEAIAIVFSNQSREAAQEAGMTIWQLSSKPSKNEKLAISPQKCFLAHSWMSILNFLKTRYGSCNG